jgi:hypothetical protein
MREVAKINKSTVATKVPHHDKTQPTYDVKANRRLTKTPSCKFPTLLDCSAKNDFIYQGVRYHSLYRGRVEYNRPTRAAKIFSRRKSRCFMDCLERGKM